MRWTLLLRLSGPMQSWGSQSRFTIRDTNLEPTKSGVIGLVCAALGRDRAADISDVAGLRMGVRVDREGVLRRDFHTAGRDGFMRASGAVESKNMIVTERFYLSDAEFLVGLEGEDETLLRSIDEALDAPVWPVFLGRKAFPPSRSIRLPNGLQPAPLLDALRAYPQLDWPEADGDQPPAHSKRKDYRGTMRYVVDYDPALHSEGIHRLAGADQPISFEPRRFALREVMVIGPAAIAGGAP